MRRSSFARVFPGLIFCLLVLFLVAGRSKLPPQLVYRYLQHDPAKAEEVLRIAEARQGNGGWLRNAQTSEATESFPKPDLSVVDMGTALVFAQVGDGQIPGTQRFFQTTLVLINQTAHSTSGTIEFFDNGGNPLVVAINGVSASSFPFTLASSRTARFSTSGTGAVKVGWAHVHSEQPISGTATFGIRDNTGRVYTDVGVEESPVGTEFMLFADMIGQSRTGVALANPGAVPVDVQFQLIDRNGVSKGTRQVNLPAWGHWAQYLDETFTGVSGIQEFEGSVVLTSTREFHGVTLRETGEQLTSMPMVRKPAAGTTWTKIALAHIGDGTSSGLSIKSSVILMNNLTAPCAGTVQFYLSTGGEMMVTIGGTRASTFNFSLAPNAVTRFLTSGTGALQTGFAVVSMDQPITGTGLFSIYNSQGALDTEVGVGTTPLQRTVSIIADSLDVYNTGIALAYPIPADLAGENRVQLTLYDRNNAYKAAADVNLKNFEHKAQFLTELFPAVAGIEEFDGRIDVNANQYVAVLSLRQAGTKLTSMPYFQKRYGFGPTSTMHFAQDLAGAVSPTLSWRLLQNGNDFALENLTVNAPGLGFNATGIGVGDRIGFGNFIRDDESRTYELVAREFGSLIFDLVEHGPDGTAVVGEGELNGEATRNLAIDLRFFDKKPYTYVGSALETEFWLAPGIVTLPASPGTVAVTTEFQSVSVDPNRDSRLLRRTTEQLTFKAASATQANLLKVFPIFVRPGVTVRLEGNQFGSNPLVLFNFEQFDTSTYQTTKYAYPVIAASGPEGWTAKVPLLTGSDPTRGYLDLKSIQVDNGSGPGNKYETRMNFAPVFRAYPSTTKGGASANVSFSFEQAARQFSIVWFQVGFFGVTADLASLQVGASIGTGKYGSDTYALKVKTVSATEVVVDVVEEGYTDPFGEMKLQRFPDALPSEHLPGLGVTFRQLEMPVAPQLLTNRLKLEWTFTGLPLVLPQAGNLVSMVGNTLSSQSRAASSGLQVDFNTAFVTSAE